MKLTTQQRGVEVGYKLTTQCVVLKGLLHFVYWRHHFQPSRETQGIPRVQIRQVHRMPVTVVLTSKKFALRSSSHKYFYNEVHAVGLAGQWKAYLLIPNPFRVKIFTFTSISIKFSSIIFISLHSIKPQERKRRPYCPLLVSSVNLWRKNHILYITI
jgi:hypothetical protein